MSGQGEKAQTPTEGAGKYNAIIMHLGENYGKIS